MVFRGETQGVVFRGETQGVVFRFQSLYRQIRGLQQTRHKGHYFLTTFGIFFFDSSIKSLLL